MMQQRYRPARRLAGLGIALAMLIVGGVWQAQPAAAQSGEIDVTTTAPEINTDGACSLAEAVENANTGAALHTDCAPGGISDTTIRLAAGEVYSFTTPHNNTLGNNALPVITSEITLAGNGATLTRATPAADPMRFLYINISGTLTLQNVTLTQSDPTIGGTVVLFADGGAIYNVGTLHIHDSTLHHNNAANGGAIYAAPGSTLTIDRTTLRDNQAIQNGGALAAHGVTHLTQSALYANRAEGNGGGIYHADGTLRVANSTLSHNQAAGTPEDTDTGFGGAIANAGLGLEPLPAAQVEIINSSLISNTASQAGGALSNLQGISGTAQITVENTILAFNSAPQAGTEGCYSNPPFTIASRGHNLQSDNSCAFNATGDLVNTNPNIGPLADNGGPTWTHALLPSSPAIGKANAATCLAPPINQRDQRGVFRLSVVCDIGAFEFDAGKKFAPILMVGPANEAEE
ncbi:MAG: choice-of-anchor Q domain-containing protein [Litorilinea sp.]